jgi:hypothetical protein
LWGESPQSLFFFFFFWTRIAASYKVSTMVLG